MTAHTPEPVRPTIELLHVRQPDGRLTTRLFTNGHPIDLPDHVDTTTVIIDPDDNPTPMGELHKTVTAMALSPAMRAATTDALRTTMGPRRPPTAHPRRPPT